MRVSQMVDEFDFRVEQRSRRPGTVIAPEHTVLAAVVHAEVHFERRFGREHFFAQHAPVKVLRVRFHQVFLHVLGRAERRGTLLARVLGGSHEEMADDVLLVVFEVRERQMAVRTRKLDFVSDGTGDSGRPDRRRL